MAGKQFEVEWSDFSGGHFFGSKDTKQPQNTWVGDNVIVCAADGFLMPGAPIVVDTAGASDITYSGGLVSNGGLVTYKVRPATLAKDVYAGGAGYPLGTTALSDLVPFNGDILVARNGSTLGIFDPTGPSLSTGTTTPVQFTLLQTWDGFALGTARTNRLYFSAAYDATSWNSNDYVDIGNSDAAISAIVPTPQGLLIGTATGWWQLTGVLGQTTSQRQITTKGLNGSSAVEVDAGIFFGAGSNPPQAVVRLLAGTQTPTVLWDKGPSFTRVSLAKVGGQYVFVSTINAADATANVYSLYMWSEHGRNWRKIALPTPYSTKSYSNVAFDPSATASSAYILVSGLAASFQTTIYTYSIDPLHPPVDSAGTAYQSATVDLAGYDHKRPFRIDELLVELDLGATTLNATRSIGVTIKAPSAIVDYHTSLTALAANTSTAQTYTLPTMATTDYERPVIRYNPNDAGPTMSCTPSLTMRGVKVRRVIARCTEDT